MNERTATPEELADEEARHARARAKRCSSCGADWSRIRDDELPDVVKAHYNELHGLGRPAPFHGLTAAELDEVAFYAADYERAMQLAGEFRMAADRLMAETERLAKVDPVADPLQRLESAKPPAPSNPQTAARKLGAVSAKLDLLAHQFGNRPLSTERRARLAVEIVAQSQALIQIAKEICE